MFENVRHNLATKPDEMSMNNYSCRVVQLVLRYDNPEYLDIKQLILSQIDATEQVLDKFIQHPSDNQCICTYIAYQHQMLDALLYGYNKPALVADLVRNEYGNYVIQTIAEVSMCKEYKKYLYDLIDQIQTNVHRTDLIIFKNYKIYKYFLK
ncbi:hypothetical protein RFI_30491 [Reticulomyxa filosa]|uniref:PUM-HD domain-containing protein n=1 Tax=Reticulomyxa filosa TaxID=46433 RepID=X6M004_RETFI|nr:hypothetical protein RFI_30491 [Reticulomyxa filosa]|eukprot:ETO06901.1 hypothetical protein RFI_30491 [Reticulomyxa filosa]